MQKKPWMIYLWPGLPHIWTRGSWTALGVAIVAAVLICAAIVGSFGWAELITPAKRNAIWASLAAIWCVAAMVSAVKLRRDPAKSKTGGVTSPFARAIDLYLKGDYYQAERELKNLLDQNVRDLEARLMLATLLRHTGRFDEASKQLDQLVCFDGAEKWDLEIQAEREQLDELDKNPKTKPESGTAIAPNSISSEIAHAT
jgi:hypothetical protein